jgi:YgiT-type zinc finger domain-containing protein
MEEWSNGVMVGYRFEVGGKTQDGKCKSAGSHLQMSKELASSNGIMGKCAVCRIEMIEKRGEMDLRIKGRLYSVTNVSYEECQFCGEKVISPELSKILYKKIQDKDFVEQSIRIPVLDGTYT